MIIKLCARCQRPIPYGGRYCPDCSDKVEQGNVAGRAASSRRYNSQLDKRILNFYKSKAWEQFRLAVLAERGYRCEGDNCDAIAVEVHHIKHLDTPEGWEKRLDKNNCKIVCIKCHNFYHKRFGGARARRPGG